MTVRVLLALACLTASRALAAPVSLGIEATIGAQHLGLHRAPGASEDLTPMGDAGATVLLRLGPFALGAAAEGNFDGTTLERFNASGLAGLTSDLLPVLRLELLGEVGVANLRTRADVEQAARREGAWEPFYGFRPGLSVRFPVLPLRVGVWGLARWNMPGAGPGAELGLLGRAGIEF